MKQTAVEWLYYQIVIRNTDVLKFRQFLEKAKEMEKQQTMNFALEYMMQSKPVVDYYNETYGDNK
jgi:hypothetical protein